LIFVNLICADPDKLGEFGWPNILNILNQLHVDPFLARCRLSVIMFDSFKSVLIVDVYNKNEMALNNTILERNER
jgi:hypothetical protein